MTHTRKMWLAIMPLLATLALSTFALLPGSASAATPAPYTGLTAMGMPAAPQPWNPTDFAVAKHLRNAPNFSAPFDGGTAMQADHGADCSPPPAQHPTNGNYADMTFICHDHMMTAINSDDNGYGEIVFQPNQIVDWSGGATAHVSISVSTNKFRSGSRSWISFHFAPFNEQQSYLETIADGQPDAQNDLSITDIFKTDFSFEAIETVNGVQTNIGGVSDDVQSFVTPSAVVRTPFDFYISATHLRVAVAGHDLFNQNMPHPLNFTQAVFQSVSHSYTPAKENLPAVTWHWSDLTIDRAVPYFLAVGSPSSAGPTVDGEGQTVTFNQPAPANTFVRFQSYHTDNQISFNNGATWQTVNNVTGGPVDDGHALNVWLPVPAGAQVMKLRGTGDWYARDFYLMSTGGASPPPTPTNTPVPPTPTNTPIPPTPTPVPPTPTPIPPTPTPGPTPIPINNVPCTVTLNGVQQTGTCSGTFNPNSGGGAPPTPTPTPTPIPPTPTPTPPPTGGAAPRLTVRGNALVNADTGTPVRLHGVNMDGADYACVQGWGMTDYPANQTTIDHLKAIGVNAVRLPMNEDCWLGNSGGAAHGGPAYQSFMATWIHLLENNGITPIPEIQMDSTLSGRTQPGPDTALFWTSFTQFMGPADTRMLFDTFNEPHNTTWAQWRAYQQPLVDAIRNAGGQQAIALEGLQWAQDMSGWLANRPTDPQNKLMASFHGYGQAGSCLAACWAGVITQIAAQNPIYVGEFGYWGSTNSNAQDLMTAMDKFPSTVTTAWTYNAWPKDEAMVTDWNTYGLKPWGAAVVAAFAASKH